MFEFKNKNVLITGGTSGIGRATALAFAKAGANVVITGRREKEGSEVVSEGKRAGGSVTFFKGDITKNEDVQKAVETVLDKYGPLNVAFNNAGVELLAPLDKVTEGAFRRVFDINVWGVLNSMKHEVSAMLKSGGGAIINNSSVFGHLGFPNSSVYVASKHAVEGLTKAIALEFAKQDVRVNSVAPGAVATDMVQRIAGGEAAAWEGIKAAHPVGRIGTVEEIAAAVLYLASDWSKFTVGASLVVDGGFRVG
jgi:NAD(P)-dependent dehydrogenase (short-subunit alcohol dehydrogenase family)